jgi:hypothetical protein
VLSGGQYGERFFPWPRAGNHKLLRVRVDCENCRGRCSQTEAFCVTHIEPAEIVNAYVTLKTGQMPLQLFPTWTTPLAATG